MERCVCVGINNNFGASGGRGLARLGLAPSRDQAAFARGCEPKNRHKQLSKHLRSIRSIPGWTLLKYICFIAVTT